MFCSSEKYPAVKLIFVGQNLINLPSHLTEKKIQEKGTLFETILLYAIFLKDCGVNNMYRYTY